MDSGIPCLKSEPIHIERPDPYQVSGSLSLISYRLYVMHFEALLGFTAFTAFAAGLAVTAPFNEALALAAGFFSADGLSAALKVQLLFVQRPSITSEPHSQNSAKNKSLPGIYAGRISGPRPLRPVDVSRIILYHGYGKIMLLLEK